ncbi:hypothetical protein ACJX0J_023926, partial [Zea mays]
MISSILGLAGATADYSINNFDLFQHLAAMKLVELDPSDSGIYSPTSFSLVHTSWQDCFENFSDTTLATCKSAPVKFP